MSWNARGDRIAVGGETLLRVFDVRSNEFQPVKLSPLGDEEWAGTVTKLAWHPDHDTLLVSSQHDGFNGLLQFEAPHKTPLVVDQGRGVAWSPDGERLAIASTDEGHLSIWTREGKLLNDVPRFGDSKGLTGVAWSPDGAQLLSIGARLTFHNHDGTPVRQIMHRPEAAERLNLLLAVKWHPSGEFFVLGDYGNDFDHPELQFRTRDGVLFRRVSLEDDEEIRELDWNHDGSLLASATDHLRIWTQEGKLLHTVKQSKNLWGVAWHPTRNMLLTSSADTRLTLWDARGRPLNQLHLAD